MSHFSLLVIGDNPESQVVPFHEFESTGIEAFIQDIDVTEQVKSITAPDGGFCLQHALEEHGLHRRVVDDESSLDIADKHKYGYAIVKDDTLIKAVRRTNPNARWDWYQIGGRWSGLFKLKPGKTGTVGTPSFMTKPAPKGYVDSALKMDIDVEGMRTEAATRAGERWEIVRGILGDSITTYIPWKEIQKKYPRNEEGQDRARNEYQCQPAHQKMMASKEFFEIEEFLCSKEDFIDAASKYALCTFAVLKDGVWYEHGKMGWWGTVSDEKDQDTWLKEFSDLVDSIPDTTLLTVIDCHI